MGRLSLCTLTLLLPFGAPPTPGAGDASQSVLRWLVPKCSPGAGGRPPFGARLPAPADPQGHLAGGGPRCRTPGAAFESARRKAAMPTSVKKGGAFTTHRRLSRVGVLQFAHTAHTRVYRSIICGHGASVCNVHVSWARGGEMKEMGGRSASPAVRRHITRRTITRNMPPRFTTRRNTTPAATRRGGLTTCRTFVPFSSRPPPPPPHTRTLCWKPGLRTAGRTTSVRTKTHTHSPTPPPSGQWLSPRAAEMALPWNRALPRKRSRERERQVCPCGLLVARRAGPRTALAGEQTQPDWPLNLPLDGAYFMNSGLTLRN